MPAPALIAFFAVSAACFGLKSSGSIKAAQIGARFVLCSMYFSTAPGPLDSSPYARKVVTNVLYTSMSALLVGYLSSRLTPQARLPQATRKTVSCDVSSPCDVILIVIIPHRGHAKTFGRVRLVIRRVFLLSYPNSLTRLLGS